MAEIGLFQRRCKESDVRIFIAAALACVAAGCGGIEIVNKIDVTVPEESRASLEKLARRLAAENQLEIQRILIDTIWHPNDTAGAIIEYREHEIGDGVYQSERQFARNSSWPGRFETKSSVVNYPKELIPASSEWTAVKVIDKIRVFRMKTASEHLRIHISDNIDGRAARHYIDRLSQWTKRAREPGKFPDSTTPIDSTAPILIIPMPKINIEDVNRIALDREKNEVTFYCDKKLSGWGCVFDVSGEKFVFKYQTKWVS
jgi:hypothetical protein